jgi:AAA domain
MNNSDSETTANPVSREFKRSTPTEPSDLSEYGVEPGAETEQDRETHIYEELLRKYRAALLTSEEFEDTHIKPRQKLVGEWFWEGDLGFVYGERGIGKTFFVDALAVHLSIGKDLDTWVISLAEPVLYLDGEMPQEIARDRLKGLAKNNKNLHVLHHDRLFELFGLSMNLANPLTQQVLTTLCVEKKIKALMLDNLSCLVSGVKENDADAWEAILQWLLELRRRRIAVIIVHHSGRSGFMRGTTKREDPAAWVIKIQAVEGRDQFEEGAKFETSFTKIRNTPKPEWIRIWHFKTEVNGEISIGCDEISTEGKVLQLIQDGLETTSEIANELVCAASTVSKFAKRLEAKKLIEIKKRRYYPRAFMNEKEP